MKIELVNYVKPIGCWNFCFVTKIKNGAGNERDFNLAHKTNLSTSSIVREVHRFTDRKMRKMAGFVAETVKRHVSTGFLDEHYVVLLTYMRASRIFAHSAAEPVFAGVNTREDSGFEVHSK